MEKALKQDEIDALFAGAQARAAEQPAPAGAEPGAGQAAAKGAAKGALKGTLKEQRKSQPKISAYNFARAGQINNEQMRAISILNDMFARNLAHSLGVWLRGRFQVALVSAEQMPFSEFVVRIPDLSYIASIQLEPLGALSVLQLDLSLAPPVVDLLLGGHGKPGTVRELTDIEESIMTSVVDVICRELSTAWQPVGLSFSFDRRQMQSQLGRVMPVTEKTLCLSFEIRLPEASGVLNLAVPAVVSNTILRRLVGERGRSREHPEEIRRSLRERADRIRIGAALQLPSVRVPARDLDDLRPGDLVRLGLPSNSPAELRVTGMALFAARPVSFGEHRGAHLGEIVPAGPGQG
jgi:flagellar motor switch protein FliM